MKKIPEKNFKSLQEEADLTSMFGNQQFFNPYTYYYKLYKRFPHRHWYKDINKSKLVESLGEKYDLNKSTVFETHIHSKDKFNQNPGVSAYILTEELLLCLPPSEFGSGNDAQVYFSDSVKKPELNKVLGLVETCFVSREIEKREILLLMQDADGKLDFFTMHIQNAPINLALLYNSDLTPINEILINRLNKENDKGIVILYGKPGTGKTSYIRYLSANTTKQKLFVPSSLIFKIGSPEFLALLKDYKNSILILEDADLILSKRSNDDDLIISNLLNLADGVLSDFFHIQIICTFSKELNHFDPGLTRKGRLLASYYFKELSVDKTKELFKNLGYATVPDKEMILADIFNYEQTDYSLIKKVQIGF